MKAITATIVGGRVEVPEEFAIEGAQVVVLAPGSGEPILLSSAEERELWEAMEEIRRGEYVESATVEILALWHTSRGSAPRLS